MIKVTTDGKFYYAAGHIEDCSMHMSKSLNAKTNIRQFQSF